MSAAEAPQMSHIGPGQQYVFSMIGDDRVRCGMGMNFVDQARRMMVRRVAQSSRTWTGTFTNGVLRTRSNSPAHGMERLQRLNLCPLEKLRRRVDLILAYGIFHSRYDLPRDIFFTRPFCSHFCGRDMKLRHCFFSSGSSKSDFF